MLYRRWNERIVGLRIHSFLIRIIDVVLNFYYQRNGVSFIEKKRFKRFIDQMRNFALTHHVQ